MSEWEQFNNLFMIHSIGIYVEVNIWSYYAVYIGCGRERENTGCGDDIRLADQRPMLFYNEDERKTNIDEMESQYFGEDFEYFKIETFRLLLE